MVLTLATLAMAQPAQPQTNPKVAFAHPEHVNLVQWPGTTLTASSGDPSVLADRLDRRPFSTGSSDTYNWVQLDLGKPHPGVCRVRLVIAGYRGANAAHVPKKFRVLVGNDEKEMAKNAVVKELDGNTDPVVDLSFEPASGRFVRVEMEGAPYYTLGSLGVYSTDPKPYDLRYPISDAAATGTTVHPIRGWWHGRESRGGVNLLSEHRIGFVGYLDDQPVYPRVDGEDTTLRIDLPQAFNVKRVRIGYEPKTGEKPGTIQLLASTDDITYRPIVNEATNETGVSEFTVANNNGLGVAKYLRLTLPRDPANAWKMLTRVEIYGTPAAAVADAPDAHEKKPAGTIATVDVPPGATLSAGIFDVQGLLVRTLHAVEPVAPGARPLVWDGNDDFAKPAPAGEYEYRALFSRVKPEALPSVGNTGQPPHGPTKATKWVTGIAFDAAGNWYQTSSWDESGLSVRRYNADAKPGWSFNNNGSYGIAADDAFVYVLHADIGGETRGQRIIRLHAANGQTAPYPGVEGGWPTINVKEPFPKPAEGTRNLTNEQNLWHTGSWDLIVDGDELWASNYRLNQVQSYDKATGQPTGHFAVNKPLGMAVDPDGNLWIANSGDRVTCYTRQGQEIRTISGLKEPFAVDVGGPEKNLYLTEHGTSQVHCFSRADGKKLWSRGRPRVAGKLEDDSFQWTGHSALAVSPAGRYFVADAVNQRTQVFEPDGKLWHSYKADFAQPGPAVAVNVDPSMLLSGGFQYQVDLKSGDWAFTHNWTPLDDAFKQGATHKRKLSNGREYIYYMNGSTWGPVVYAIDPATGLARRSSMLGGLWTGEDDQLDHKWKPKPFTWQDKNGDGKIQTDAEVTFTEGDLNFFAWHSWIGLDGAFWVYDLKRKEIERYSVVGFDEHGNPQYRWDHKTVVIPAAEMTGFNATLVRPTPDNSEIYLVGTTEQTDANWKRSGLYHQGGYTIVRYGADGKLKSRFQLPIELESITTDGRFVYAGQNPDPQVVQVMTPDGLVVAQLIPGAEYGYTRGWLDTATPMAALQEPGTNTHHVYTEDVVYSNMMHWRFEATDQNMIRQSAKFTWPGATAPSATAQ